MNTNKDIPLYDLTNFRPVHRENTATVFGYNNLHESLRIPGFEIYSSEGLISAVGPLKSDFYRVSITCKGSLDMQIGLENYQIRQSTISLTYPNQIFAKNNISKDAFGYYILFDRHFLDILVSSVRISSEFPFFEMSSTPVFTLSQDDLNDILELIFKINTELMHQRSGRVTAVRMYLYLILLAIKRSYEKQSLHLTLQNTEDSSWVVSRFRRLVAHHYLGKQQVSEYADLLAVSANYLNRVIKKTTGRTASETIKEMILLEAKALLKNTDQTISEIAYKLSFGDPASFSRFFKTRENVTPTDYRDSANPDKLKAN